jgi:ribosomal protein L16/L10AE
MRGGGVYIGDGWSGQMTGADGCGWVLERRQELKEEVSFKERQLESSQMTMQRLVDEKNKRLQVRTTGNGGRWWWWWW